MLPEPECLLGYPVDQVEEIVHPHEDRFWKWMRGQTGSICGDHGLIVYDSDLRRFLEGGQVID